MSIPNAQNLVSREEIKITEYVFIGNMPEEAKEYEQGKRGDGQIIKFHLFVSID